MSSSQNQLTSNRQSGDSLKKTFLVNRDRIDKKREQDQEEVEAEKETIEAREKDIRSLEEFIEECHRNRLRSAGFVVNDDINLPAPGYIDSEDSRFEEYKEIQLEYEKDWNAMVQTIGENSLHAPDEDGLANLIALIESSILALEILRSDGSNSSSSVGEFVRDAYKGIRGLGLKNVPQEPTNTSQISIDEEIAILDGILRAIENDVKNDRPGKESKRKGRGTRGPKRKYDPKKDQKLAEAWATKRYKRYKDLAVEYGTTEDEVRQALDRHRKRQKKRGNN